MLPILPLAPLMFLELAWLSDLVVALWGAVVVAWFHATLGVTFVVSFV